MIAPVQQTLLQQTLHPFQHVACWYNVRAVAFGAADREFALALQLLRHKASARDAAPIRRTNMVRGPASQSGDAARRGRA
jgi:hypothetical protein